MACYEGFVYYKPMDHETQIHAFLHDNQLEYDVSKITNYQYRLLDIYGRKMYDIFIFSGKILNYKTMRYSMHFDLDGALKFIKKDGKLF